MARSAAQSPHDALFKSVFSQVKHARPMLRAALPAALAKLIQWSTLAVKRGSFVDSALKQQHTDLLFSVLLRNKQAFLYLLFEHQSTVDRWMPFRLLQYMVAIWQDYVAKAKSTATSLPMIIPIVVHHSPSGWTYSTHFEKLFDADAETAEYALRYLPRFEFLLDDVSHTTNTQLRKRAVSALAKVALSCLRSARQPETLLQNFLDWIDLAVEIRKTKQGVFALQRVLRYIFDASPKLTKKEIHQLVSNIQDPDLAEDIVTLSQHLRDQGRVEGKAEGRVEGRAELLLRLLRARFGKVPSRTVAKIKAANEGTLNQWADQMLNARTLSEALALA